jgi:hypothetical protein
MENIETLMGKYGDEGDKLLFKILNNGLHLPEKKRNCTEGFSTGTGRKKYQGNYRTRVALRSDHSICSFCGNESPTIDFTL